MSGQAVDPAVGCAVCRLQEVFGITWWPSLCCQLLWVSSACIPGRRQALSPAAALAAAGLARPPCAAHTPLSQPWLLLLTAALASQRLHLLATVICSHQQNMAVDGLIYNFVLGHACQKHSNLHACFQLLAEAYVVYMLVGVCATSGALQDSPHCATGAGWLAVPNQHNTVCAHLSTCACVDCACCCVWVSSCSSCSARCFAAAASLLAASSCSRVFDTARHTGEQGHRTDAQPGCLAPG
jgi:hypothetical protein